MTEQDACTSTRHAIAFEDMADPCGSRCRCGAVVICSTSHDPHGRLTDITVLVDYDDD